MYNCIKLKYSNVTLFLSILGWSRSTRWVAHSKWCCAVTAVFSAWLLVHLIQYLLFCHNSLFSLHRNRVWKRWIWSWKHTTCCPCGSSQQAKSSRREVQSGPGLKKLNALAFFFHVTVHVFLFEALCSTLSLCLDLLEKAWMVFYSHVCTFFLFHIINNVNGYLCVVT